MSMMKNKELIHLTHKQPISHLHNLYMKKRVNTFGDNRHFGGAGEWGLILPPWQEQKRCPAPAIPPMSFLRFRALA